jgi:hypothetical protein
MGPPIDPYSPTSPMRHSVSPMRLSMPIGAEALVGGARASGMSDYHMYVGNGSYAAGMGASNGNDQKYSSYDSFPHSPHGPAAMGRTQTYGGTSGRMGFLNASSPYTPSKHSSMQSSLATSPSRDPQRFLSPRHSESPNRFARANPASAAAHAPPSRHTVAASAGLPLKGDAQSVMQSDAMMFTITQLQNDIRNVKDMVQAKGASASSAPHNPLEMELEKVKGELQAREDEITRLRALHADRKEAIKAHRQTNDHRATLPGFDRSTWNGHDGGNFTAVGGVLREKAMQDRATANPFQTPQAIGAPQVLCVLREGGAGLCVLGGPTSEHAPCLVTTCHATSSPACHQSPPPLSRPRSPLPA